MKNLAQNMKGVALLKLAGSFRTQEVRQKI